METFKLEYLANGTAVAVNKNHRFGTDAMLLSHFCNVKRLWNVCDFGTGCGIIPLRWKDMGHIGKCTGVEITSQGAELFQIGIKENNLENISCLCTDVKELKVDIPFDLISCNPPYFTGGFVSDNIQKATARHQISLSTSQLCSAVSKNLKDGGNFCLCQRPENLADVMACMREARIEPKRLRFVKQKINSETPWLFLLEGRKNGKIGLNIMKDLIMEDENGDFSREVLEIYGKI